MATATESPIQFERDLRSANHEWKRSKDSAEKWARGTVASPGVHVDCFREPISGSESQQAKMRPRSRYCDSGHQSKKPSHNLVKMRKNWDLPAGRVRSKLHAKLEVNDLTSRSLGELPPTNQLLRRSSNSADGVLYSFDRSDTPGRPLTLDIFVKAPTARDTERFVEKEYEILDTNGEALKGRKARNNLRQTTTDPGMYRDVDDATEDDGFELL